MRLAANGLLARSNYKIGQEMIAFQNDEFGKDIEAAMVKIEQAVISNKYTKASDFNNSREVEYLCNLTFDRLGIKSHIVTNESDAAIMPFYINKNHAFIHKYFRGDFEIKDQEKLIRNANNKKGFVNNETVRVGGIFSEHDHTVWMNFNILFKKYKFSTAQVTAIYLHEIGHAFYTCSYSDRIETVNQILSNVALEISKKKQKTDITYVFRELKTINKKITEEEIDKLINGNKVIASTTWFKVVVGSVGEQMSDDTYSNTSSEQLADNFASRFGYGKHLIIALDKMHLAHGSSEKSKVGHYFYPVTQVLALVYLSISCILLFTFNLIPMGILLAIALFAVLRLTGEDFKDYTYDELKLRYQRVRNELVEALKSNSISEEQVKTILEDIQDIDVVIKDTYKDILVLNPLANLLFSGARRAVNSVKEQQMMENLTFNDLFIKAKQLELLSN